MASRSSNAASATGATAISLPTSYSIDASRSRSGRTATAKRRHTRPRTALSAFTSLPAQEVICAVSESRGISPTVGLAFINLDTCEAVLCQICDNQTYVRTIQKLFVYHPSEILIMSTAANPKSKLFAILEENLDALDCTTTLVDRRHWAETSGLEYIQQLAFKEDMEAIKLSIAGNYFAVCCFAAVLKSIENGRNIIFPLNSLRIKYEPSEGSMMIDVSTTYSLELIQNLQQPKSRHCLFGLLHETQSPMGTRLLRNNILQPLTSEETLNLRFDALEELTGKEEMFFAIRQALKDFVDADRLLTSLVMGPDDDSTFEYTVQCANNIIMLKHFIAAVGPASKALAGAQSELLTEIRELCAPRNTAPVCDMIDQIINGDVQYSKKPLDLRYQRIFAVKAGVNALLDVSRTTFKENCNDAVSYVETLKEQYSLSIELKHDESRQFYLRFPKGDIEDQPVPNEFVNVVRKRDMVECTTLNLMKRNQKVSESHFETVLLGGQIMKDLIANIRQHLPTLFKICEAIAMLDMLSAFAHLATTQDYVRPEIGNTLAIKAGRHPVKEKMIATKFVSNDVYATRQNRFQIITGCNMSGKSTYIRSIVLMTVMAQMGSFVPAEYAMFPIHRQLFARIAVDDSIEGNVSTFATEMREAAFILRNIDDRSIAIMDELGRGTSTQDGLAIAIAMSEALVESKAFVWFATHFVDLANILAERNGVVSLHLKVDMLEANIMKMLYKVASGAVKEDHYGLILARVFPLPLAALEHATLVAEQLSENLRRRRQTSKTVLAQRRRRLILNLKEHLVQAHNGNMQGETLNKWLEQLQRQFVERMIVLDQEVERVDAYNSMDMTVSEAEDGFGRVQFAQSQSSDLTEIDWRDLASSDILLPLTPSL